MAKRLNPLEKEFLVRRLRENSNIKLTDFCTANDVSVASMRKWIDQYNAGGLEGLAQGRDMQPVLPEGVKRTEENYKREIMKLRIENERLKKKLYSPNGPRWGKCVHSFKGEEFGIVQKLAREYPVRDLCKAMGESRSGYYKWLGHPHTKRDDKREMALNLVPKVHGAHPSHGYRWVAAFIRINYVVVLGDNLVYKAFAFLGIRSESRHQVHYKPRKIKDKYPNLIFCTWDCVDRPRQVIVSDMTAFHADCRYYELTMYFDVFTKQIVSYALSDRRGDRDTYVDGLKDVLALLNAESVNDVTYLHTDQGSVYASVAYNELIRNPNVVRSMSRAGTPTDNPVNESLNGWIKEELMLDFNLANSRNVPELVAAYVRYYNHVRPSYALGYDTPDHYYERFQKGELARNNTFSVRVLNPLPKYLQKRRSTLKNRIRLKITLCPLL